MFLEVNHITLVGSLDLLKACLHCSACCLAVCARQLVGHEHIEVVAGECERRSVRFALTRVFILGDPSNRDWVTIRNSENQFYAKWLQGHAFTLRNSHRILSRGEGILMGKTSTEGL